MKRVLRKEIQIGLELLVIANVILVCSLDQILSWWAIPQLGLMISIIAIGAYILKKYGRYEHE